MKKGAMRLISGSTCDGCQEPPGEEELVEIQYHLGFVRLCKKCLLQALSLLGSPQSLAEIEREAITHALVVNGCSTTKAAQQLGISVRKIQYRLKTWREAKGNGNSPLSFAEIEREVITRTLTINGGSTTKAAAQLGISVRKIQGRLKDWRDAARARKENTDAA